MPIPASGFCLSTVCAEFIGTRLAGGGGGNNLPSLDNMVYWGSQQNISIGTTTCRLSQFANKCRGSIIGTPSATLTAQNGIYEYCVCVSNQFGAGDDFRPTNSTSTDASIIVCWVHSGGYGGGDTTVSAGSTTTTATLSGYTILYNPDPVNGNVTTTIYAQPRVFNGFGLLGDTLYNVGSITWLAEGL
jgi:hypothetical protein